MIVRLRASICPVPPNPPAAIYELVVRVYFHPTPLEAEQARQDPGNHWVPDYGPDAARLHVFYAYGRWFAVWEALEEKKEAAADPSLPEWRRWSVVRIVENADPSSETGVTFLEV